MTEPISAPHVHVILMRALGPHYVRAPFERYLGDVETPAEAIQALDDLAAYLTGVLARLATQRGPSAAMARDWCEHRLMLTEQARAAVVSAFPGATGDDAA